MTWLSHHAHHTMLFILSRMAQGLLSAWPRASVRVYACLGMPPENRIPCFLSQKIPFSLSASDCKVVGPTQMVCHCKPFKRSPRSPSHWDIPNFNWEIFRGKTESPPHTGPLVLPGHVLIFWHGAVDHPPKTMGSFVF